MGMRTYWWFKPDIIVGLHTGSLLVIAALIPNEWYLRFGGAPKFIDFEYFTIGVYGLLFFVGGAWLGARPLSSLPTMYMGSRPLLASEIDYRRAMYTVLLLTLTAYVLHFHEYIANPFLLMPVLRGEPGAMYVAREIAERTPGITSLTNAGPLYVVLYASYSKATGAPVRTWDRVAMAIFILFCIARVIIFSERVALMWVAIPFALVILGQTRKHVKLIAALPVILVVLFVPFFAMSEYLRSWSNHYVNHWESFWDFIFTRLTAYYATALNNGVGMMEYSDTLFAPVYTAEWFWKFPIEIVPGGMTALFNMHTPVYQDFLINLANPEYNNRGGLFVVFWDFGILGGLAVWWILGWISGRLYHGFANATAFGLLLYPSWYVSMLEIPRVFAFGATRSFVLFNATLLVIWWLSRRKRLPRLSQTSIKAHNEYLSR